MRGIPVAKISVTTLILVFMFLASGVILSVTGNDTAATSLFAIAGGVVIGSGLTTVTVVQDTGQKLKELANGDNGKNQSNAPR